MGMQRIERSVWSALSPRRFALCENQSGEDSRRSIRSALLNTQLETAVTVAIAFVVMKWKRCRAYGG